MKCYIVVKRYDVDEDYSPVFVFLKVFKDKQRACDYANTLQERVNTIKKKNFVVVINNIFKLYVSAKYIEHSDGEAVDVDIDGDIIYNFNIGNDDIEDLFNLLYREHRQILVKHHIDLSEDDYHLIRHFINKEVYDNDFCTLKYDIYESRLDLRT